MRFYTPLEIRQALATVKASTSLGEASRISGIPRSTLRLWRDGKLPFNVDLAEVTPTEQEIIDVGVQRAANFRSVEALYLEHLRDAGIITKTSAKDSAIVVGILEDKATRAEGGDKPTAVNIKVAFVTPGALRTLARGAIGGDPSTIVVDMPALGE